MRHLEKIILGLPLLAATVAIAASQVLGQTDSPQQQSDKKAFLKAVQSSGRDRGQQVFEQNCARCHDAPQGFSSNISDAVAMHMRVRAKLSDPDYKALRRFLNP